MSDVIVDFLLVCYAPTREVCVFREHSKARLGQLGIYRHHCCRSSLGLGSLHSGSSSMLFLCLSGQGRLQYPVNFFQTLFGTLAAAEIVRGSAVEER